MADGVWQALAVLVAVAHLVLVAVLVAGGFAARRRLRLRVVHAAVAAAVVGVALVRAPCPLTDLELWLRGRGGVEPYRGGFVEHYLVAPVYPPGVTTSVQLLLYAVVLAVNAYAYGRPGGRRTAGAASL